MAQVDRPATPRGDAVSVDPSPLRVLLLTETFHPEIGGGERQAAVLAAGLMSRGHQVTILTRRSRRSLPREEVLGGIHVLRVGPTGPGRLRKWGLLASIRPALRRLRGRYDVALVAGFRILAVPVLHDSDPAGPPVVLKADSPGEMSGEYFRAGLASRGLSPGSWPVQRLLAWRNRLLLRADAFVAMGAALKQELVSAGVSPMRISVIPNGVDTAAFRPAAADERDRLRSQLGLPKGPVVAYTGRLVRYKGLPVLLAAWRELVAAGSSGTLVLVGEGGGDLDACESELRDLVAREGLGDRVRFTGAVDNVADWLRAADVFAFPTEVEAFGLALVEAMACGLASVTTSIGGLAEFVEDESNALVVSPRDRNRLRDALRRLLADPALRARLGARARERVVQRFSEAAVATAYERVFRDLVAAQAGAAP